MTDLGRRLPVYLLLDTSRSMSGEPIAAVQQGMKALISDLKSDPQAMETVYLSVITFNSSAQQLSPLVELPSFMEPQLSAGGSTAFGEALQLLENLIDKEVRIPMVPGQKGDWKPRIFILIGSQPTDTWEAAADRIKQKYPANIIACAAGAGVDPIMLKRVTETVVELNNFSPETFKAFFKWESSCITNIFREDERDNLSL